MNPKRIGRNTSLLLLAGLALIAWIRASADSNTIWEAITAYRPVKSASELKAVKPGETVVNVCNDCKRVVLVHLIAANQGQVSFNLERCRCGSTNTFAAVREQVAGK